MARPIKRNPYSGEVLPAVEAAADYSTDGAGARAWIKARYHGRNLHPLAVHFAERWADWSDVEDAKRQEQIGIEKSDRRQGAVTMLGADLHGGVLDLRSRFEKACGAAAMEGDGEFFRTFHEVYSGLRAGEFPVNLDCLVLRSWQCFKGFEGSTPTKAQVLDHIMANPGWRVHLLEISDKPKAIENSLVRLGLEFEKGKPGPKRGAREIPPE